MKLKKVVRRQLGSRGFSHHFILPVIAVIAVVGIGMYTLNAIHAASAQYYVGPCTGTTYTKTGTSGACVNQAKDIMDGLQHANWHGYRTATTLISGSTFKYGPEYYLDLNKNNDAATQAALKKLTGSSVGLTPGTDASDGWQVFCATVAKSGINLATNTYGKAALNFKNGNLTNDPIYKIFTATCGQLTTVKKSSSSSSSSSTSSSSSSSSSSASTTTTTSTATASGGTPPTLLGIWQAAEDNGNFSTVAGQKPDVANDYLAWQGQWPSQFVSSAEAAGATPFIELEPWNDGNTTPQFSDIVAGKYDSWLASLGSSVKSLNKPVIFTFAHEFNISGQYPWAVGDTGSCGSSSCSPAQWIQAWDHVESVVNSTAGGHAYWMWCPNVDSGGSNTNPTAWWPGASEVQMVGVDGYPSFIDPSGGTFQSDFGQTFSEIHTKTSLPIFISETNLSPLGSGGFESISGFIKDMAADGGDGILQFQEGLPSLSATQWSQLNTALAQYVK